METPDLFPDSLSRCLFCGAEYATDYCLKCGPPVGDADPTPGELLLEAQLLYEDEDESANADDFEGDDAYARQVCVRRWGEI